MDSRPQTSFITRRYFTGFFTPVSNYTAWWQRHVGVNNLPRVATQPRPDRESEPATSWLLVGRFSVAQQRHHFLYIFSMTELGKRHELTDARCVGISRIRVEGVSRSAHTRGACDRGTNCRATQAISATTWHLTQQRLHHSTVKPSAHLTRNKINWKNAYFTLFQ